MKNLRKTLYPLAVLYNGITRLRNVAYDQKWLTQNRYDLPLVGVGNLNTGGTGKSPMTEYLIRLLRPSYRLATISRGYGRKTKGFLRVQNDNFPNEVGDEPLQFKKKFPDVDVIVDEKRVHAVNTLLNDVQPPEVVILDDVFQHRSIKPGLMIMLTSYDALFYHDYVLPAGNLRESRSGARRAHAVVVTKCPPDLDMTIQNRIKKKINSYTRAQVFFSSIAYDDFVQGDMQLPLSELKGEVLTVVTGIAKPTPFINYLKDRGLSIEHKNFPDHHKFTNIEISQLENHSRILTTEKDFMRLRSNIKRAKLYYLPIKTKIIDNQTAFDQMVLKYCQGH